MDSQRRSTRTNAGCVAQSNNPILVVSLHLQHSDAVIQLLRDYEWIFNLLFFTSMFVQHTGLILVGCNYITEIDLGLKWDWQVHLRLFTPIAYESWAPTKVTFPKLRLHSSACPLQTVARRVTVPDAGVDSEKVGWAWTVITTEVTMKARESWMNLGKSILGRTE